MTVEISISDIKAILLLPEEMRGKVMWARRRPIVVRAIELKTEVLIKTREGVVKGYPGDYLVEGIKGELYPVGRGIFEATHERFYEDLCASCADVPEEGAR